MLDKDEEKTNDYKIMTLADFIRDAMNRDPFIQHWVLDFSLRRGKMEDLHEFILDVYYPHLVGLRKHKKVLTYLKPGLTLDGGCGTGWLSLLLYKNGHKVVSIDLSMSSISLAKKLFEVEKADIPLVRAASTYLPFRKELFDSIVMCDVVEHIPDIGLAMSEVKRVTKNKAKVSITIPNGFGWWEMSIRLLDPIFRMLNFKKGLIEETHVHYFTKKTFEKLLQLHGFKDIVIQNIYAVSSIHGLAIIPRFVNVIDSKIADRLPTWIGTEWSVNCKK